LIRKTIETNIIFDAEITDLFDSRFVPSDVKEYINSVDNVVIFRTSINKRDIQLKFYNTGEKNPELENKAILLFTIFNILSKSSTRACSETLKINLFLTDFKKNLPVNKTNILGCDNANSAVTYHCAKNGTMLIFRKEEVIKVFIHESIHALGLDWVNNNVLKNDIRKIFDIKSDFKINEAYTEFWANILNCCLISYKLNKKNTAKYIRYVNFCITVEQVFSIFQLIKVLKYMGLSYPQLYKTDPISKLMRYNYKETSNIFSYYILKTVLLFNHHGFLNLCDKHNSKLFNFKDIVQNGDIIINFIKDNYKNNKFLKIIEIITHTKNNDHFINNTTRLTAMELSV
jgi:hypothetical protein